MSTKDHDNAVSALVAIQLQISATIHGEQDPLQSLANIGHIFNKLGFFIDLPHQNVDIQLTPIAHQMMSIQLRH